MVKRMGFLFAALALSAPAHAGEGDAQDPILRTFAQGEAARAAGDYAGLLDAAVYLNALGATPAEGQADIAADWTRAAHAAGVTRSLLGARGRALGPAYRHGQLPAGGSVTTRQLFLGGQKAQVAVAGDGLVMRVRDAAGNLLCERMVDGAQADCIWRPDYTGRVDISLENGGDDAAAFTLLMR